MNFNLALDIVSVVTGLLGFSTIIYFLMRVIMIADRQSKLRDREDLALDYLRNGGISSLSEAHERRMERWPVQDATGPVQRALNEPKTERIGLSKYHIWME